MDRAGSDGCDVARLRRNMVSPKMNRFLQWCFWSWEFSALYRHAHAVFASKASLQM